jgi:competence protein ComEC
MDNKITSAAAAIFIFLGICYVPDSLAQNLEIYCVWGNGGGGTCTFVRGPNGTTALLDETGGNTEASALYDDILTKKGITSIDYAVACHYDTDHINGLDDLVSKMGGTSHFGTFYDRGGTIRADGSAIPSAYYNLVNPSGKRRTPSLDGSSDIDLGNGGIIRFLSVGAPNTTPALHVRGRSDVTSGISENNKSISVLVTYGGFDFYFGSDLEGSGEEAVAGVITQDLSRDLDVLHVDHHGADTYGINSLSFLQTMDPEVAVISVWSNSHGHPRRTTVERLQQVVEPLPQRIIRLAPGDEGDAAWAPEDMAYCLTTNRHLVITTDGTTYTVSTVPRSGGNDITEPGLTNHSTEAIPTPTPPPPITLHPNKTLFSTADNIVITADVGATANFTPYIRIVQPGGKYLYLVNGGVSSSTEPFIDGPLTLNNDVSGYVVAQFSFSGLTPGDYALQGALLGNGRVINGISETILTVQ